jgi:hypothetical protein
MEKEDVTLVAQLLTGIKDAADRLQEAERKKDLEKMKAAKKEILNFQSQIDKII